MSTVVSSKLELRQVDGQIKAGINRLLSAALPPFLIGKLTWSPRLTFLDTPPAATHHHREGDPVGLEVILAGHRYMVHVPVSSVLAVLRGCIEADQVVSPEFLLDVPGWMVLACLEGALGEPLKKLEKAVGAKMELALLEEGADRIGTEELPSGDTIAFEVALEAQEDREAALFSITAQRDHFLFMADHWPAHTPVLNQDATKALADIHLLCHLSLCRMRLARSCVPRLRVGDVVSLGFSASEDGAIAVRGAVHGAFFLRGRLYPDKLVIDMVERNWAALGDDDEDVSFDDDDLSFEEDDFDDWDDFDEDEDSKSHPESEEGEKAQDAEGPKHQEGGSRDEQDEEGEHEDAPPRSPAFPSAPARGPLRSSPTSNFAPPQEDTGDITDSVPLPVDLRIARLNIPIKNFKTFAPGMTINLQETLPPMVDFVSGDKVIAEGELVEVDGALGVVITHLGDKKA